MMKKFLSYFLVIVVVILSSNNVFASALNENQISESYIIYDSSDTENYSQEEKDKIESAWKKAMQQTIDKKQSQSGELEIVGTLGGRPLYAKTEVSETTKASRTKSASTTYVYDFGWGAGLEEICKVTVKGTFNIKNGVASVVKVEGTYTVLDNRCSAKWDDSLRISSSSICQIGFNLYCNGSWGSITQSAYVDGASGYYVLIHN